MSDPPDSEFWRALRYSKLKAVSFPSWNVGGLSPVSLLALTPGLQSMNAAMREPIEVVCFIFGVFAAQYRILDEKSDDS